MKFYQLPVIFVDTLVERTESYYDYLNNDFMTVTEDEMAQLTLLGSGFYGTIFVNMNTEDMYLGTEGGCCALFPSTSHGYTCAPSKSSPHSLISFKTIEYPEPESFSNIEHNISFMYADFKDRLRFLNKKRILRSLKSLTSHLHSNGHFTDALRSSTLSVEYVSQKMNDVFNYKYYYTDLYNEPTIHDFIEELKTFICQSEREE